MSPGARFLRGVGRIVDDAIFLFAPGWGYRRRMARIRHDVTLGRLEQLATSFDDDNGGRGRSWDMAKSDNLRGSRWLASGLSPDAGLEEDLQTKQERCASLYRNSAIAHGAIESRVANETGVGISAQPLVRAVSRGRVKISQETADAINDEIQEVIRLWSAHGVDKRRQFSLSQVQRLINRSYAVFGESFVLLATAKYRGPNSLVLDVIAPERVETPPEFVSDPNVRLGVRYSNTPNNKEVIGYYVRESHPGEVGTRYTQDWKYYERFDSMGQPRLLHIFDPLFPEQSRGIPWLAAAANRIKDLDDFVEAELIAKQIEACFGLIFKGGSNSEAPVDIADANKSSTDSDGRRLEEIEPGMIHYAGEDEEVTTIDPSRPGANFAPFVEHALRSIAASLNFPYELLAKNFFRTTFSSGQLAMLDGRLGFRMRRQVLIDQGMRPIYRRLIFEQVFIDSLGGLIPVSAYRGNESLFDRHEWTGQGWGHINPLQDVKANDLAISSGQKTLSDCHHEGGTSFDNARATRHRELLRLAEDDIALRKHIWELEEKAGLPHREAAAEEPNDEDDDEDRIVTDDEKEESDDMSPVVGVLHRTLEKSREELDAYLAGEIRL